MAADTPGPLWAPPVKPAGVRDQVGRVPLVETLRAAATGIRTLWSDSHFDRGFSLPKGRPSRGGRTLPACGKGAGSFAVSQR